MPILNGDASGSTAPLLAVNKPPLDYAKALEILEEEYDSRDGLSVYDLIDSKKNGALTYNDFLVLPGYIGKQFCLAPSRRLKLICLRLSSISCHPRLSCD